MEYLDSLSAWPKDFWLGVALGCFVTFLFAFGEFDHPTFKQQVDRPETGFLPQELTTRREYLLSFILYVSGLELVYLTICIIGPAPFTELGATPGNKEELQSAASFPLWVALTLIGIMPRLPILAFIEQRWRQLMHERASIPQAALSLSQKLRRSEFEFGPFRDHLGRSPEGYGAFVAVSDLEADRGSPSHRWARLSAILWQIDSIETDSALEDYVDFEFIDRHRPELDAIRFKHRDLAEQIDNARSHAQQQAFDLSEAPARFHDRTASSDNDQEISSSWSMVPDNFMTSIDAVLRRVCIFLACSIIAKSTSRRALSSAMQALGFSPSIELDRSGQKDVVIKGFMCALASYLLLVFLAPFAEPILPFVGGGWPERETTDVFLWTFSVLIMHGCALATGLTARRYFRARQLWFGGTISSPRMPDVTRYIVVTIASCVTALVVISYWDGVLQGANVIWSDLGRRYPFTFVASTSALFSCILLDRAHVYRAAPRLWSIVGLQVVVTLLLALIAASRFYQPDHSGAIAFTTISAGLFALTLGASMSGFLQAVRQTFSPDEAEEALT